MSGLRKEVLKKIHPDLYATQKEMQQANTACLSELQDLWAVLTVLLSVSNLKSGQSAPEFHLPSVRASYGLKCFLRQQQPIEKREGIEEEEEQEKVGCEEVIQEVVHTITLPKDVLQRLSQRNNLTEDFIRKTTQHLLRQQAMFLKTLGVADPWTTLKEEDEEEEERSSLTDEIIPLIDQMVYDRSIIRKHRKQQTHRLQPQFSLHRANRPLSKGRRQWVEEQAVAYLDSEHVHVRALDSEQEMKAMERLAAFLVENAQFIKFGSVIWQRIVIVLDGERKDFEVQREDGEVFVLYLPRKFKHAHLIDFLHDQITETCPLDMEFIQ
eukprot:gene1217-1327_t